jgi:argininosuccinate lyase
VYTETVLEPSHRFMVEHYFHALSETNKAWVAMLVETGIVAPAPGAELLRGLRELDEAGPDAIRRFEPRYEYFYSHMERFLIERLGEDVAGEIDIARTRPEPLARIALRARLLDLAELLAGFCGTLLDLAGRELETVMPQWTHLQPAQVSTLGHYLVGVENALVRDLDRLLAAYRTTNECTLGCGALAGTSYPVDRGLVADLLGFDGVRENTLDSVASADHMLEALAAAAGALVTASRLGEDFWLWCSEEFGFLAVSDEFAGSSSMMPQKKNAYPFEIVRGRASLAIGDLAAAYGILRAAPFQDLKDVEEEVVTPVLRTLDEAERCLRLLDATVPAMEVRRDVLHAKAAEGFAASTELAAAIHRSSELSMRSAHRVVANLVRRATERGVAPADVDAALLDESAREVLGRPLGLADEDVRRCLDPSAFVAAHAVLGGPAPDAVRASIARAGDALAGRRDELRLLRRRLAEAHARLEERVEALVERPLAASGRRG